MSCESYEGISPGEWETRISGKSSQYRKTIHKTKTITTLQTLWLPRLTQKTKDPVKTIARSCPGKELV